MRGGSEADVAAAKTEPSGVLTKEGKPLGVMIDGTSCRRLQHALPQARDIFKDYGGLEVA